MNRITYRVDYTRKSVMGCGFGNISFSENDLEWKTISGIEEKELFETLRQLIKIDVESVTYPALKIRVTKVTEEISDDWIMKSSWGKLISEMKRLFPDRTEDEINDEIIKIINPKFIKKI